ncbi:amino acid ABC transporter permease [Marivibrio halodurans]|uniref:Amino acid ABC transporter permease n=1 Tax=Marivibrio halodurans TaxID=2039722 RepID=A0A8J7SKU8_9PROT|nr:amino acid ABC transporter permease [Marivibrio halodurans]MBP5856428.1 amino acid ABC transporter permease [Marivibrio halodurans]
MSERDAVPARARKSLLNILGTAFENGFAWLEGRRNQRIALAVIGVVFFMITDLRGTGVGELLRPAIGDPMESGLWGLFATAVVMTVAIAINVFLITLCPGRLQLPLVWLELFLLFLTFFYSFDLSYEFIAKKIGFLVGRGAFTTIYISLVSIAIACVIALFAALARMSRNPFAFGVSTFYISFFRGLPLLMQIYLIYIGLPQLGFVVDPVPAGIAALSICYGAYLAEIFRAGIQGVPRGQREAAMALGLRGGIIFRKIVMPQAMKLIVPPTGNQFIAMLKDSSLVSVVGVWELTFLAKTQGRSEFKHMEMLITAALVYWALSICFEMIQARIERHYGKADAR